MAFDKIPDGGATLTTEQVRDELLKVAQRRADELEVPLHEIAYETIEPDDVIRRSCVYFHPTRRAPSCIVGQWMNLRYGITLGDLEALDPEINNGIELNGQGWDGAYEILAPNMPEETRTFLTAVQTAQDEEDPWMKAIKDSWDETVTQREIAEDNARDGLEPIDW